MSRKRYKCNFIWKKTPNIPIWYRLAFIVNQKWKTKIYKLRKVHRISILQLARSKSKNKKKLRYEPRKMVLNQAQD